jgi:hypothetical protein
MHAKRIACAAAKWSAFVAGLASVSYATYAGVTWFRYGKRQQAKGEDIDPLLDRFMRDYDVVDRHRAYVAAPADITLAAAAEMDFESNAIIRGVFKTREWLLRAKPDRTVRPRGFMEEMKSLGWAVLSELPGREVVAGAVTKPWEANPIFLALPPDEFAAFSEPGYVKIAWTLRATPAGNNDSIFRTETRAVATDAEARRRFRRYWSFLSPGIIAIRRVIVPQVKAEAERCRRSSLVA